MGPTKRRMPGAPNGENTGRPTAPAARYSSMLVAPSTGPSIIPARMTIIGRPVRRGLGYALGATERLDAPTLFGMAGSGGSAFL